MSRTLIVLALRRALACKGYSVRCQILLRNIKLFDILLSSRGVDGRGGLPPRQSSLVLLGILWLGTLGAQASWAMEGGRGSCCQVRLGRCGQIKVTLSDRLSQSVR